MSVSLITDPKPHCSSDKRQLSTSVCGEDVASTTLTLTLAFPCFIFLLVSSSTQSFISSLVQTARKHSCPSRYAPCCSCPSSRRASACRARSALSLQVFCSRRQGMLLLLFHIVVQKTHILLCIRVDRANVGTRVHNKAPYTRDSSSNTLFTLTLMKVQVSDRGRYQALQGNLTRLLLYHCRLRYRPKSDPQQPRTGGGADGCAGGHQGGGGDGAEPTLRHLLLVGAAGGATAESGVPRIVVSCVMCRSMCINRTLCAQI